MKRISFIITISVLLFFTNCQKLLVEIDSRKYDGEWELVEVVTDEYDNTNSIINTTSTPTVGKLKLYRDGFFEPDSIADLSAFERAVWSANSKGKGAFIYFGVNEKAYDPNFDKRADVLSKSKKEMELSFHSYNSNNNISERRRYKFKHIGELK